MDQSSTLTENPIPCPDEQYLKYFRPLSPYELLENFPEESKRLVGKELKRHKILLEGIRNQIIDIRSNPKYDEFTKVFLIQVVETMADKRLADNYKKLKVMQRLMCQTTRDVNSETIARAKRVNIWTLYDFKKRHGKVACCPFHDDANPSFSVSRNRWVCYSGCGYGDAIDFIMKLQGIPFYKAVDFLSKL